MTFSFKVKGLKGIQDAIRAKGKSATRKVKAAINLEAELVMTESKQDWVPIEFGVLKNSGVVIPDPDPNIASVTLGFGGAAAGYAVHVHENMESFHAHGSAKYLERPLLAAGPAILKAIADVDPFS